MAKYDSMLIGYAVNQKSGGYDGKDYSFLDTSDAKYLYNNCFLDTYCAEPMAFEQLAAEAEAKGFSVDVQDGLILGYTKEELIEILKDTDCLAIKILNTIKGTNVKKIYVQITLI